MRVEGRVGVAKYADDLEIPPRLGSQGEFIVSDMNGLFYEQTMRGNAFAYSTVTAASVTALGNNLPSLWNPLGSGKNIVIHKVTFQAAAIGVPVISGFQYGLLSNAGAQIGTGSPIITFTSVAPVNLLLGAGLASVARWGPAVNTYTVAPALLAAIGLNLGATATQTPWSGMDDVNGRIIIAPGNLLQIAASTATSTTFNITIWGFELPVPGVA